MKTEPQLGKLIDSNQQRDAIHIAIVPVIASETLAPGYDIGFVKEKNTELVGICSNPIGIVDPFLTQKLIILDQRFWMFLYPNTVTSLRHVWEHPAFVVDKAEKTNSSESEIWLQNFAEECGITYDILIEAAKIFISCGEYHILCYDTPNIVWTERENIWEHITNVVDLDVSKIDKESTFIGCAC